MGSILQYIPGNSLIHRMNPVTKIFLTVIICVAAFITNNFYYLLALLVIDLLIGLLAGVADRTCSLFRGLLKIAIFLFILQALMTRRGTPVFWVITDEGLKTAGMVVLRLMVVCMPLALVLAVTRISDLTNAMVEVLHVPYKYAFTLATAIRFIPKFLEDMNGIMEAQTARGADFSGGNLLVRAKNMLPILVPLFISAFRRADDLAVAMEARCYRGDEGRTKMKELKYTKADYVAKVLIVLFLAMMIGSRFLPGVRILFFSIIQWIKGG